MTGYKIVCFLSIVIVALSGTITIWKLIYKEKELHAIAILMTIVSIVFIFLSLFYFIC